MPPLPYLLPMLAIFVILVMLVVVVGKDLGTALLFFGAAPDHGSSPPGGCSYY